MQDQRSLRSRTLTLASGANSDECRTASSEIIKLVNEMNPMNGPADRSERSDMAAIQDSMMMKEDQRLLARKVLRSLGTLMVGGREQISFDTINIGTAGMDISLSRQLNAGQRYNVKFALLVNGTRSYIAEVARVTHCVCGRDGFKAYLQFIEIDSASASAVEQFMRA